MRTLIGCPPDRGGLRQPLHRQTNAPGGHGTENDRAPREPHSCDVRVDPFDLGGDTWGAEVDVVEAHTGRQNAPVEIADLDLGAVTGGRPLDPPDGGPAGRFGLEDRTDHKPEDQDEGNGRQHGDDRASEVAVSHPPRSPHFSFRCRTWK